ncbi:hypothetical protein M8Z33_41855 [Streptomyces sp. ZAF1911]|uniref:hypothetical protein n=1 Tax=Streptomyces sp. ZAF1911 TaxID=2944129 RepID=UPI00237A1944|nr:hypothetical protein [Streptomyces sp. ZAF1911]MDD9383083.1 hypothetical protein [Streptomyces sp. ZAF1911]
MMQKAPDWWLRYLPAYDMQDFFDELVNALGAPAVPDKTAAVAQLITEWQHTAEVYADPKLKAALTADNGEDYGPVPEPGAA